MGDRCYMTVRCRNQDVHTFEALGFDIESQDGKSAEMFHEQANYACSGDLPTDVPFTAAHGPGGDYGAGVIACNGKEIVEADASEDGTPIAGIQPDGTADARDLESAMNFYRVAAEADSLMDETGVAPTTIPA